MRARTNLDERGWYWVLEPEAGRYAPESGRTTATDGQVLTKRLHGTHGRIRVIDRSGAGLHHATSLRVSHAVGETLGQAAARVDVVLGPAGTEPSWAVVDGVGHLALDGPAMAKAPSHHVVEALVSGLLADGPTPAEAKRTPPPEGPAVPRAMFFESLMNSDMPHNDDSLSQGVVHIISPLRPLGTEVVLVNVKMPIEGLNRPVWGLDRLTDAVQGAPIGLVCITLLEGYWEGVVRLIGTLRELGCRAHIAVGGVMPSLAPEHVAAHLPEVSFVCRGAGEYFTPALARILGDTNVDTPLTDAQQEALLSLDGIITVGRAGEPVVLSGHSARVVQPDDLDGIDLDVGYLEGRHMKRGIEISTSRGCIHRCVFCSILGRGDYRARSADGMVKLLEKHHERFREVWGDDIPRQAFRVHFCDEDFACDKARAKEMFTKVMDTPFRLSSVQVAITDLCRREPNGKLLPEPDHELLDAIKPEVFDDYRVRVPIADHVADHRTRKWSSYLQIGVETYSTKGLVQLGKGYKFPHVRAIVHELNRRKIHMDGYFILSNYETTAEDMVEVFENLCRLKLRYPKYFHLRFPIVRHLVSYFTAASHRRILRRGRRDVLVLRGHAAVEGHGELDYPFVDMDRPDDPWVALAAESLELTDQGLYTANLRRLRAMWLQRWQGLSADDPERARLEPLLRRLDAGATDLVVELFDEARTGESRFPEPVSGRAAITSAGLALGAPSQWKGRLDRSRRFQGVELVRVSGDWSPAATARVAQLGAPSERASHQAWVAPDGTLFGREGGFKIGHLDDLRALSSYALDGLLTEVGATV